MASVIYNSAYIYKYAAKTHSLSLRYVFMRNYSGVEYCEHGFIQTYSHSEYSDVY